MGFSEKKYHEYGMKISWKKHENPLNIQRFMAREKTLKNKKPMKMQWNKMKPTMFFSLLFNGNEKTMIWKAIFHGVRIYGVFVAVSKFMPNKKKKTWVFREQLNINVHEKWNGNTRSQPYDK